MASSDEKKKQPLWLAMEEKILDLDGKDLSGGNQEAAIQQIAGELDSAGFNVSKQTLIVCFSPAGIENAPGSGLR